MKKKKRKERKQERKKNKQTKKSDSVTVRYTLCTYTSISHQSINQSINFIYPRIYSVATKC